MLASALGLSGCGITYVSPLVSEKADDGVQVIRIGRESVAIANRSPYAARSLPEVFSQTAGGATLRGAGALPESPVIPDVAPGQLKLQVPPPATPEPYRICLSTA